MTEINLMDEYPKVKRDYDTRASIKTPEVIRTAKKFGYDFFDGDRLYGYGGFKYDGRWKTIVDKMKKHYNLPENASILDIGCAKGFMLYDFKQVMPKCTVEGIDISTYAIDNAMPSMKPFLKVCSAEKLPYPDKSFDLVISINTIHNLPIYKLKQTLREIQRVSKGNSFIVLDAWRNEEEHKNFVKWNLTAETYMSTDDWKKLFKEVGYTGDYYWFIAD